MLDVNLAERAGSCAALAYDSATPFSVVGLPMLNAPQARKGQLARERVSIATLATRHAHKPSL